MIKLEGTRLSAHFLHATLNWHSIVIGKQQVQWPKFSCTVPQLVFPTTLLLFTSVNY